LSTVLRFLATGDTQIHNWKQFSYTRKDGMNSRLYNCLKVFDILSTEAKKRGIRKILLNGDLFEETDYIQVEIYDAAYQKLEMLYDSGLETVINLGNHDLCAQLKDRTIHSLRPFRKVAQVIEQPQRLWKHLYAVPYTSKPERLKKAVRKLRVETSVAVLVLHCGIQGGRVGPKQYLIRNPIKLKDIRPKDFNLVLLSDYHTQQWLASNVLYLGSPLQHSFGETHRPCIWDVTLYDKKPWFKLEKIYTNLPRFRQVRVYHHKDLKKLGDLTNDFVRVILPLDSKVEAAEVEALARGKFQLQIDRAKSGSEQPIETVRSLRPEEAIERYARGNARRDRVESLIRLGSKIYLGEK